MKSFQDWLDCQLYSSHLKNLTKIKQQSIYMKTSYLNRKLTNTTKNPRNISNLESSPRSPIKNKQYNRKYQMQKTQIMKQNFNLASRLINVSSVISKDKQVQSYRKYQSLFKKNTNNKRFDCIKSSKLRNFMKINESNYVKGLHKYIVKIKFIIIPYVSQVKEPMFWVQLFSGIQKVKSTNYTLNNILMNEIIFPLKKRIDRNLMLRLNCSRGLQYINLGDYYFETPAAQATPKNIDLVNYQDSRKSISINIQIQNLKKYQKHSSLHLR